MSQTLKEAQCLDDYVKQAAPQPEPHRVVQADPGMEMLAHVLVLGAIALLALGMWLA